MLIFSSDWHLSNKYPLRTVSVLNFMQYLEKYMQENNINNFVMGGDLIDHNNKIDYKVFAPIFHKFNEWKKNNINVYFVVGNHDQISNTETLLELLEPLGVIVNNSITLNIDGFDYDLMPYTNDVSLLPNKSSVLLSHLDCVDFYYNPFKKCESAPFTIDTFENYDKVILGHFHRSQGKNKIVYPGIPFQHNYSEEGQTTYFAVIDKDAVELIEYEEAPQYITLKIEDILKNDKIDFTNKYVKVQITNKVENFVKLKTLLYSKGAIDVAPDFIRVDKPKDEAGHTIDVNQGIIISATKYIKGVKAEGIDNKKLSKTFQTILKELK